MTHPAGGLLSGQPDTMLGYTLVRTTPPDQQLSGCGGLTECQNFVTANAGALQTLTNFMTMVNNRFDQFEYAARQGGHEYLAANEQNRISIESVQSPAPVAPTPEGN
ncbi:hypothetical protein ACFP2T_39245 [Plantactinospora solaniradicis]|uniref:PE domain-containing protein n=1 Tax=Plantactinospora solaniradicis TaxID=1723736 RepID=A0ABW1KK51_9ACTN